MRLLKFGILPLMTLAIACGSADGGDPSSGSGGDFGAASGGDFGTGSGGDLGSGGGFASGGGSSTGGASATGGASGSDSPPIFGYVGDLGSTAVVDQLDYSSVDYVVAAFYSADGATAAISDVWNVDAYIAAGLMTKANAAGAGVILSFGGANHSASLKQIAADEGKRNLFAQNVVAKINQGGFAGVDLDIEFPVGGQEPAQHLALMTAVYDAVKANNPSSLVLFGVSPGYYIDQMQWSQLGAKSDYAFYFCYDWDMPANGPMMNPGKTLNTFGGATIEASCRGAINYMMGQGYPAAQIVLGMGFYASGSGYVGYESIPAAAKTATPDPNYMEALDAGLYWLNAAAARMKVDAVLSPSASVLNGGVTIGGVGFWEWGLENPASPDVSQAIRDQVSKY